MNRRVFVGGLGILVALWPASGYAQSPRSGLPWWTPWEYVPEVVVVSTESDYRLPAIREAIDFWNSELSKLGSAFRFGSLAYVAETVPSDALRDLRNRGPSAEKILNRAAKILSRLAPTGDVIVALSNDAELNAFASATPDLQKVIVAIPELRAYMHTPARAARNVVAHELGHTIGLGHNDNPNTLMSGDARWWLGLPSEGFLPITPEEQTKLLKMYPSNWQPKPSRGWITDPPYPRFGGSIAKPLAKSG